MPATTRIIELVATTIKHARSKAVIPVPATAIIWETGRRGVINL